jgi:hypothetical protein
MNAHRLAAFAVAALALSPVARAQQNRFEPNQTRRTAHKIEPGDYKGLLCNEEDWYFVDVPRGQRLEVEVKFQQAQGDLELMFQDSRGRNLAWSRGTQSEEVASFLQQGEGPVFVRVHNATNTYDLHVGITPLPVAQGAESIDDVNCLGADWYAIPVEAGKEVNVEISFQHAQGDLDLTLFDEEGNELAASTGEGDTEQVRWTAAEAKTTLLRVWNPHRARSVYRLRFVVGQATPDDMARVLRRDRPTAKGEDLIELTNGDVLHGTVLNESFRMATPYTEVELGAERVAGIDLERNRTEIETIVTVDNNKLAGFLRTGTFRVKLEGLEQPVDIRRERLLRVIFGCRGGERAGLERHQYIVLKNGDHFSAKIVDSRWVLDTGFAQMPLALEQLKSITFDKNGGVQVTRLSEMSTRGRLSVEEIELEMDIAQGNGRRFKVHPDRIETLYCQEGYMPDNVQSRGSSLSFDFEDGIEPWTAQGTWNTNFIHWPQEGVRGDGCMRACGPNGANYGDNSNITVTSPPLQIGGFQQPVLRFQCKTRLERGPDFFVARVSFDNGQSFTELHRLTGDNEWTPVSLPLTPGQRECVIQFGLTTDGSIVNQGLWIDAVEVVEQGQ